MIKKAAHFVHQIGDRVYQFICEDDGDKIHEIKEALSQFMADCVIAENNVKALAEKAAQKAEEVITPTEEVN